MTKSSQTNTIPESEMKALQELFISTNGESWVQFGVPWNFSGFHDPCEEVWEGLECTCAENFTISAFPYTDYASPYASYYYDDVVGENEVTCHISKLYLGFSHLVGSIPATLNMLGNLTRLHMENNYLRGQIPSTLGQLQHLQLIVLHDNEFTGTWGCDGFDCWSSVRLLFLFSNR